MSNDNKATKFLIHILKKLKELKGCKYVGVTVEQNVLDKQPCKQGRGIGEECGNAHTCVINTKSLSIDAN